MSSSRAATIASPCGPSHRWVSTTTSPGTSRARVAARSASPVEGVRLRCGIDRGHDADARVEASCEPDGVTSAAQDSGSASTTTPTTLIPVGRRAA